MKVHNVKEHGKSVSSITLFRALANNISAVIILLFSDGVVRAYCKYLLTFRHNFFSMIGQLLQNKPYFLEFPLSELLL